MNRFLPCIVFSALVLLLTTASCETTVEIEPPRHEPRLVINGLFETNDETFAVNVSRSVSFEESGQDLPEVENATVVLRSEGRVLDTLSRRIDIGDRRHNPDTTIYYASRLLPRAGATYEVRVSAPGFKSANATSRVPERIPFTASAKELEDAASRHYSIEVDLTFTDPSGEANYYQIMVLERQGASKSFTSADPLLRESLPFEETADQPRESYYRAFFSDQTIGGQKKTITLRTSPSEETRNVVVLHHLSRSYFKYLRTRVAHYQGQASPFAEPSDVHSNVEGGLGIFAGAAATTRSF